MTFDDAKNFVLPFGKYKGKTLHDVGGDDEGLLYLDWVVDQQWLAPSTHLTIRTYLKDPAISRDLDALLEEA
jgi:uncharacterized protein (DUF3820 family)